MNLALIWSILKRLPWKIIGPVAVVLALGLCVRHEARVNARADAYARVAAITAKYSHQQEVARMQASKQANDSIAELNKQIVSYRDSSYHISQAANKSYEDLRAGLTGAQRAQLDTVQYQYAQALAYNAGVISYQAKIIDLRTRELNDAEQRIAGLQRENAEVREELKAARSSPGWKLATGAALVVGVVAYALHP